ncbi:MAG: hypothetical protein JSV48_17585, partial [Bradyrhizobium sp.]
MQTNVHLLDFVQQQRAAGRFSKATRRSSPIACSGSVWAPSASAEWPVKTKAARDIAASRKRMVFLPRSRTTDGRNVTSPTEA